MPGTPATQKTFPVSWDRLHRDSLAWRLIDPVGIAGYDARDRGAIKVPKTVPGEGVGDHHVGLPQTVRREQGRQAGLARPRSAGSRPAPADRGGCLCHGKIKARPRAPSQANT